MPIPAKVHATEIPEVLMIETGIFGDHRGFFTEVYSRQMLMKAGFAETFVQDNCSKSAKGTLRGLHYQLEPHGMGKLVRVLQGAVYDVAVDLRRESPTFGKYVGRVLDAKEAFALWVPVGFAHGFLALEDDSIVFYKCTSIHAPEAERSLRYNDPAIGIDWPFQPTTISEKDAAAPDLAGAEYNFKW